MIIKELKEIIKDFPDDADILMQKRVSGRNVIIAPVISYRRTMTEDLKYDRLVLVNMKEVKNGKE